MHSTLLPEGFPPVPPFSSNSLADAILWHHRVGEGASRTLLEHLAKAAALPAALLREVVLQKSSLPRGPAKALTLEQMNTTYRIVQTVQAAIEAHQGDVRRAAAWLSTEHPGLKGRVPLRLTSTPMGTEYVKTALGRLAA